MIASDAGSVYEPHPTLTYRWDPDGPPKLPNGPHLNGQTNGHSFDLGPHPADPHSTGLPSPNGDAGGFPGPNARTQSISGQEIWVYEGTGG